MADNPYQPPEGAPPDATPAPTETKSSAKQPFSLQAAKFSLFAPLLLIVINILAMGATMPRQDEAANPRDAEQRSQIRFAIGVLAAVTTVAAFACGAIGLVGGIKRRTAGTIILALVGILINGGLIYMTVTAIAAVRELAT